MSRHLIVTLGVLALAACADGASPRIAITGHSGECALCHVDEWSDTRAPRHADARLGQQCADCHRVEQWAPAPGFLHSPAFALTLGHGGLPCAACHVPDGSSYAQTSTACRSCHADARARADARVPGHANNPDDCGACHRSDAF